MWLLHGREEQLGALHGQVLAFKVQAFALVAAREDLAPDADELGRLFVARGVVEEHAVALQLGLVAARHQVDEQPPAREAIKRGRHARRQRRLVQAGAHGHQKLEVARDGQQAGRHHPRVFARAAGGDEHAFVAQAVGRHGHLLEVVVVELAGTFGSAEVAAVAVGGDEPENFHEDL